jgi:hypothetical protein
MSLKAVHLVFVTALSALTFGMAVWKFRDFGREGGTTGDLLLGIGGLLAGVLVIVYGVYFLKKLRKVSFL